MGPPALGEAGEPGFLAEEAKFVASMKKTLLATLGFLAVNVAVSMFSVFLSPRKESANV